MNISIRKIIREGEVIPVGYGVSNYRWECNYKVAYPIPLNFIVRMATYLYYRVVRYVPGEIDHLLFKARHAGYVEGLNKGRDEGFENARRVYVQHLNDISRCLGETFNEECEEAKKRL